MRVNLLTWLGEFELHMNLSRSHFFTVAAGAVLQPALGRVDGEVATPLTLTMDDLRRPPAGEPTS